MLRTASILTPPQPQDGLRVSIMSRHTDEHGKVPDPRITPEQFDEHWTELAPPPERVGAWHRSSKEDTDWDFFKRAYLEKLRSDGEARIRMAELAGMASRGAVTIMCVEEDAHRCHRRLLAEEISRNFPGIEIVIDNPIEL